MIEYEIDNKNDYYYPKLKLNRSKYNFLNYFEDSKIIKL